MDNANQMIKDCFENKKDLYKVAALLLLVITLAIVSGTLIAGKIS
jgi:hypothetical protein